MNIVAISDREQFGNCEKHGRFERRYVQHFGWIGACQECESTLQAESRAREISDRIGELYKSAFIPIRFARKRFSDYEPRTAHQAAASKACFNYVEGVEVRVAAGACLTLLGPPGVGKTHLLTSVIHGALQAQVRARYTAMADFLAAVKGNWAWHGDEHGRQFILPRVLVLDEVWHPENSRDREALVALIDARYRDGNPTLVGSNLTWPQMREALGARLCDRLLEGGGQVLALDGESARMSSFAPTRRRAFGDD